MKKILLNLNAQVHDQVVNNMIGNTKNLNESS